MEGLTFLTLKSVTCMLSLMLHLRAEAISRDSRNSRRSEREYSLCRHAQVLPQRRYSVPSRPSEVRPLLAAVCVSRASSSSVNSLGTLSAEVGTGPPDDPHLLPASSSRPAAKLLPSDTPRVLYSFRYIEDGAPTGVFQRAYCVGIFTRRTSLSRCTVAYEVAWNEYM